MISAGRVETKIVGTSFAATVRPGICFFTSAKLASPGSAENAGGSFDTGAQPALKSGEANHAPLLSQYQELLPASLNTSQLVFTANDSVLPAIGASTGSPSNTSRLAGRSL